MNFVTQCLQQLTDIDIVAMRKNLNFLADARNLDNIVKDIAVAKKYLLPPPNLLNIKATAPALKFMKLPAPICVFEYEMPDARSEGIDSNVLPTSKSTRRLALAYDCSKNVGPIPYLKASGNLAKDANGIMVVSLYYLDELKRWTCSQGMGYIDEKIVAEGASLTDLLFDNVNLRAFFHIYDLLPDMIGATLSRLTKDQRTAAMMNDIAEELGTAVRAALLLSSKNLKEFKIVEASTQLNKKRALKGKIPFFDYWSIDIFFKDTPHYDRKKLDYQKLRSLLLRNKSDLTSEYRTVIGHFKVRATGIFLWNEHDRLTKVRAENVRKLEKKS